MRHGHLLPLRFKSLYTHHFLAAISEHDSPKNDATQENGGGKEEAGENGHGDGRDYGAES